MSAVAAEPLVEIVAARQNGDWAAVRTAAERIIADEPAPTAETFLALAQAYWHLKMPDQASHAADCALAINPTLTEAFVIAAWAAVGRSDGEKAIEYHRRLAELHPQTSRWQLKLVQLLNAMGHIDEAAHEADVLYRRWPEDRNMWSYFRNLGPESPLTRKLSEAATAVSSETLQTFYAREKSVYEALELAAPKDTAWRRRPITSAPRVDVQVAQVQGARTGVLVFTGALDNVAIPLSIFDRYMAALDVTTIYLKDYRRLFYLAGVQSLGADYDATLATLRRLRDDLGMRQLAIIGHCDGAAASINYGVDLGAYRILSFGPLTRYLIDDFKLDKRRALMAARLADLAIAPELLDLRLFLQTRPYSGHIEVFHKKEDSIPSERVAPIRDFPDVTLHAVSGYSRDPPLLRLFSSENLREKLALWLGV